MATPIDVGPMDPDKRNSPVMTEVQGESTIVMDAADRVCFWNGSEYPEGAVVTSEGGTYECSFGNWVKI